MCLAITCSMSLQTTQVSDMGRWFATSLDTPLLYTGTIIAVVKSPGT